MDHQINYEWMMNMGNTMMINSNVNEVIHLFEVMKKHNALCSMELKLEGQLDPFTSVVSQPITRIEYFDREGGPDSILVILGDLEFNFELNLTCSKDISDLQIFICIATDHYVAWFNSDSMSPEAIVEACNYGARDTEFDDEEIHLNVLDEQEFEDGVRRLSDLLLEGKVIKRAEVTGDGNQVLTVGFYDEDTDLAVS